jgi:pimeloyl-[acyl-carrier protein] synthase
MSPYSMTATAREEPLSLYQLLDPEVLANPYPLYRRLRERDPVYWDSYLSAWVATAYADVITVLHRYSARCAQTPEQLTAMDLSVLNPIAEIMVRQMLFMDPPDHTRLRSLASSAFTPGQVSRLRPHIQDIVNTLIDAVLPAGRMDVISDFANLLPATVSAEMLGVPVADRDHLKAWSANYAEVLGNFQHNPDRAERVLKSVDEMTSYFYARMQEQKTRPRNGLIHAFMTTEIEGDRLTQDEIIANLIITMVGGQETTTNLIGNGIVTLLRNADELARLRADLSLIPSAVEELLRYESPSQFTVRIAPEDVELGEKVIRKGQSVFAVMGAANRDPERFPDPDRFDIERPDNRHVAFGFASHFCFGAPLARIEAQVAFETMLRRLPELELEPGPLVWRENLGLRGLKALPVKFRASEGPGQGK